MRRCGRWSCAPQWWPPPVTLESPAGRTFTFTCARSTTTALAYANHHHRHRHHHHRSIRSAATAECRSIAHYICTSTPTQEPDARNIISACFLCKRAQTSAWCYCARVDAFANSLQRFAAGSNSLDRICLAVSARCRAQVRCIFRLSTHNIAIDDVVYDETAVKETARLNLTICQSATRCQRAENSLIDSALLCTRQLRPMRCRLIFN